ncbi:arginine utilization regulatory protein [Dethiosulfatibacter aminovorans DSM 17477]|uniref:Arginine utilization regulatory protein n=1 Tax=Dethiosulfatibacter aminovorans DSM 17477 TaxID=1121476 RepID=A0A1M6A848_9FIRM|nr:sigma 54-interacting transcriptional regulator [Dethiosulfatibacter aminovorans]SHI32596.1 arginine utilization regulatory protein [Dethiosulfatibacter aminovorans DSM 17477]
MLNNIAILENLELLKSIINSFDDGLSIVDQNGMLVYANNQYARMFSQTKEMMIGKPIEEIYKDSVLVQVLTTGKAIEINELGSNVLNQYKAKGYPILINDQLVGAHAITKSIPTFSEEFEMDKSSDLDMTIGDDIFSKIIGWDQSLKNTIYKAKKTVGALGGPRHCIITGESGTGKTMLAEAIYHYAKSIGVISKDAPFVEVNCAQFTNPDIAAMEIFGSAEGAYTGSKNKKGLFEIANGGILFLDETHRLENYQDLLLKSLESKKIKRIGGTKYIPVEVIVIGASTENLVDVLTPALYQRLAQNILALPPLRERTLSEKRTIIDNFADRYIASSKKRYKINLSIEFTPEAKKKLLNGYYPRNIRQFRDIIFASIDEAVPLINYISSENYVDVIVDVNHIPDMGMGEIPADEEIVDKHTEADNNNIEFVSNLISKTNKMDQMIEELNKNGFGPRRIAKILTEEGYNIKYYQVAYKLKNLKD